MPLYIRPLKILYNKPHFLGVSGTLSRAYCKTTIHQTILRRYAMPVAPSQIKEYENQELTLVAAALSGLTANPLFTKELKVSRLSPDSYMEELEKITTLAIRIGLETSMQLDEAKK
jgi:hypothetical protein